MAQLTVDGRSSNPSAWTSTSLKALSDDIVSLCGMQKFFGPESYEHGSLLLCFTLIAESHISLHLDRESGEVWADVFTCKAMNPEVESLLLERLGIQEPRIFHLDRGQLS